MFPTHTIINYNLFTTFAQLLAELHFILYKTFSFMKWYTNHPFPSLSGSPFPYCSPSPSTFIPHLGLTIHTPCLTALCLPFISGLCPPIWQSTPITCIHLSLASLCPAPTSLPLLSLLPTTISLKKGLNLKIHPCTFSSFCETSQHVTCWDVSC